VDNFWAAYEYLSEHGRFESRPTESAPVPAPVPAPAPKPSTIVSTVSEALANDEFVANQFKSLGNTPAHGELSKRSLALAKAAATKQRVKMIEERGDSYARIQERKLYSA
jgi:hypothetical protein